MVFDEHLKNTNKTLNRLLTTDGFVGVIWTVRSSVTDLINVGTLSTVTTILIDSIAVYIRTLLKARLNFCGQH